MTRDLRTGLGAGLPPPTPAIGPLPAVYEPFWYTEKVVAAALAAVAALMALNKPRFR